MIISVANQKGGVGKTTSAVNIGAGLAKVGKQVLLIDADPQSHLSSWVDFQNSGSRTLVDLLYAHIAGQKVNFEDYIYTNDKMQLDYIPASNVLVGADELLETAANSQTVLQTLISQPYFSKYDYIVIDCSTAFNLMLANVLKCTDKLLIPVDGAPLAYDAVLKVLTEFVRVTGNNDIEQQMLGIVITRYGRTTIEKEVVEALQASYGNLVLEAKIPKRVEAVECTATHTTSVQKRNSAVGEQYMKIVDEILKGV